MLARLGTEAEDGIDALLSQALAYERRAVDSLTGFLVWLETDDMEIKRQMDSADLFAWYSQAVAEALEQIDTLEFRRIHKAALGQLGQLAA